MDRDSIRALSLAIVLLLVAPRGASAQGVICDGKQVTITGTSASEHIQGTPGHDVIAGLGGDDVIEGVGGNDSLCGNEGLNELIGGAGDDRLVVDLKEDYWLIDLASYRTAPRAVMVDLEQGFASGHGTDTLINVHGVRGSGFGDAITGNDDVNYLYGGPGADRIDPRGGDYPSDQVHGDGGADHLTTGSSGATLVGDAGRDRLEAVGYGLLYGGTGDDRLSETDAPAPEGAVAYFKPGPGDDRVEGGEEDDAIVLYDDADRGVHVDLGAGIATGEGTDRLIDIESVQGSRYGDELIGNDADNFLWGRWGEDLYIGRGGADRILAGDHDDIVRGDAGDDTIYGHQMDDRLFGGSGNDSIIGGDDEDLLDGGSGTDELDGWTGRDACRNGEAYANCERQQL